MCAEQFILRWHYHDVTLLKNLPYLFDTDFLTDVTISIGGSQCIKAHRLVLAMCSVYFFQLFQEMGNAQHPVIVLNNVNMEDIKALFAFIYRGQCVVTKQQLPSFLSLAKLLKIQGLCDMKVPEHEINDSTSKPPTPNENNNNNPIKDAREKTPIPWLPANNNNNNNNNYMNNNNNNNNRETVQSPSSAVVVHPRKAPHKDSSETCKCFLCGKYLSNQYNLRVHMETHEETYHACQSCPHVSRSRDALRKHVSYRHPEEYHTRKRKKNEQDT